MICGGIAQLSRRDQHHDEATSRFDRAVRERIPLVTTSLIVAEAQRQLLHRAGIRAAHRALELIDASERLEIEFVNAEHHREAREWLARFADQPLTYTDAVSFAVMKSRRCRHVLGFASISPHPSVAWAVGVPIPEKSQGGFSRRSEADRRTPAKTAPRLGTRLAVAADMPESAARHPSPLPLGEASLRVLLDGVGEGVFGIDGEGRCTFANAEAERLFGYSQAEFLGQRIHELLHHSHADGSPYSPAMCPIYAAIRSGRGCRIDTEVMWRRDGTSFPVEYSSFPIEREGGGAVVTVVDISLRRGMERTLRESEARYRALFDSAQDAILVVEAGRFTDCNASALEMLGRTRRELIGRAPAEVSPPTQADGADSASAAEARIREASAAQIRFDWRFRRGDGSVLDADVTAGRIETDGRLQLMAVARDTTERNRVANELRRSESRLNEAQQIAHVGNWERDALLDRLFWSDELYRILGLAPGEVVPTFRLLLECIHPADRTRVVRTIDDAVAACAPFALDYRIVRPDGTERVVEVCGIAFRDEHGAPCTRGSLQDITERYHLDRQRTAEYEVARILMAAATEADAARQTLAQIGHVLDWDVAEFWRLDTDRASLHLASEWCRPGAGVEDFVVASRAMTFPPGVGLPGRVWASGEPAWIEDLLGESNLPRAGLARRAGLRSGFAFPLAVARGQILGVMTFFSLAARRADEALLHALTAIGAQIAQFLERKRTERSLGESERYFRRLIENSADVVTIIDADGIRRFQSASAERVLGYTPEELVGQHAFGLVHPEDLAKVSAVAEECRSSPGKVVTIEYRARHKDGSWRVLEANVVDRLDDPVVRGVLVNSRDVTERSRMANEVALQSAALAAAANGIVITDARGNIVWANPAFTRLTGYAVDEAIGRNPRFLKSGKHDPHYYHDLWSTILGGRVWSGELVNRRKSGETYVEEETITPILRNGEITHFIAIKQDVTERKVTEERLHRALEQATESERLKTSFLANMGHEVRTPLNVILGNNALIAARLAELQDPTLDDSLAAVSRGSDRLVKTIESIIDLARLESGYFDKRLTSIDLEGILEKTVGQFQEAARHKGLRLACELAAEAAIVVADDNSLRAALAHLVENAIKFTERGGVTVRLFRDGHGALCVSVADTGIGIGAEYRARLFEPFSQEQSGFTRRYEGSGIGLALVKRYLEFNRATISVESRKAEGTTFTVRFPAPLVRAHASS